MLGGDQEDSEEVWEAGDTRNKHRPSPLSAPDQVVTEEDLEEAFKVVAVVASEVASGVTEMREVDTGVEEGLATREEAGSADARQQTRPAAQEEEVGMAATMIDGTDMGAGVMEAVAIVELQAVTEIPSVAAETDTTTETDMAAVEETTITARENDTTKGINTTTDRSAAISDRLFTATISRRELFLTICIIECDHYGMLVGMTSFLCCTVSDFQSKVNRTARLTLADAPRVL